MNVFFRPNFMIQFVKTDRLVPLRHMTWLRLKRHYVTMLGHHLRSWYAVYKITSILQFFQIVMLNDLLIASYQDEKKFINHKIL